MARKAGKLLVAAIAGGFLTARILRRRRRMDFHGTSVLITGGSRGLGLVLARRFAAEGARLTLLARNPQELERAGRELAATGTDVQVIPCDLRQPQEIRNAVDLTLKRHGRIDVLINNAGVIQVGPLENQQLEDFQEAMEVHAWAPLLLSRAVTPAMQRQGGGRIVNITSIGGLVAVPHLLPYSMSKFALVGFSNGLRSELARHGIRVTTVAPGLMRTGSHVNALFKGQHEKEYAWFAASAAQPLLSTSAETAARRILRACRYGDPFLIITLPARLLHLASALFPGLTAGGQKCAVRLLPSATGETGLFRRTGWLSRPPWLPGLLTRSADLAVERNNELPDWV